MDKEIRTLQEDVYNLLDSTKDHDPNPELAASYAMSIGGHLAKATLKRDKPREIGKMWASDLGEKCMRKVWYKWNKPEAAENMLGHTKFKFLYGNIIEDSVMYLAEEAGHSVTFKQEPVKIDLTPSITHGPWEVSGRIDGVIDSHLTDVKSTSTYAYNKYKASGGIQPPDDSFGYLYQLGYYNWFHTALPLDGAGFLWVEKQNGHIWYDYCTPKLPSADDVMASASTIAEHAELREEPLRYYTDEEFGKSGNRKLGIACSYCPYKVECWRDSNLGRGLRTFLYSSGPVHLTEVNRPPAKDIVEVKYD